MDWRDGTTGGTSRRLLTFPAAVSAAPGGWVRVAKAGVIGVGPTLVEAARDLASKLTVALAPPRRPRPG
ncbi:hypothetical protein [Gemmata sp.]|uniref:hypothetical protein n=1 Tax=Gemmata sp. TaxID=1914242 RepID=UPI003F6F8258